MFRRSVLVQKLYEHDDVMNGKGTEDTTTCSHVASIDKDVTVGGKDVGAKQKAPTSKTKTVKAETVRKRTPIKQKTGGKAAILSQLPETHQQLLDLFVAVDCAYCFLVKNSIPPKVSNLQSMVWRLFPEKFGEEALFLSRLKRIADMASAVLILEEPPDDQVDGEYNPDTEDYYNEARRLELHFPQKNTAGVGKAKAAKRKQLVQQALLENAGVSRSSTTGGSFSAGGDSSPCGVMTASSSRLPSNIPNAPTVAAPARAVGSSRAKGIAREKRGGASKRGVEVEEDDSATMCTVGNRSSSSRGDGSGKTSERGSPGTALDEISKEETPDREEVTGELTGGRAEGSPAFASTPGAVKKPTKRNGAVRPRQQGGDNIRAQRQQATGTALLLSAPLSDSPAYVVTGSGNVSTNSDGCGDAEGRGSPEEEGGGFLEEESHQNLRFDPLLALAHLQSLPMYEGQAAYTETLPGRQGEFADTTIPLHPQVIGALATSKGVTRLFKHQARAIDAAMAGQHIALSTATSSGKSVVFNVSVIEKIVGERPQAVALYLFPTKALAQDQLRSLKGLVDCSPFLRERVRPMTLDGDTPWEERGRVVEEANIILTNPDMLHASVLPGHKLFSRILSNLSHVVIDEAHVYRGAFGAHVSMVMRRLLRLWAVNALPGQPPQFICCSATMRDPPAHFASLLPLEECLGGRRMLYFGNADTAPMGRKTFVLWRPPIVAEWCSPPFPEALAGAAGGKPGGWRRTRRGFFDNSGRGKKRGARTSCEASSLSRGVTQGAAQGSERDGTDGGATDGDALGRIPAGKGKGKGRGKGRGGQQMSIAVGSRRGVRLRTPITSMNEEEEGEREGEVSMPSPSEMEAKVAKEDQKGMTASVAAAAEGGRKDCGSSSSVQPSCRQRGRKAGCSPSGEKISPVVSGGSTDVDGVATGRDVVSGMGTVSCASKSLKVVARTDGESIIYEPRLEGWRNGPTDNYYNREYMKLMGAELRRPLRSAAGERADGDSVRYSRSFHVGAPAKVGGPAVVGESATRDASSEACGTPLPPPTAAGETPVRVERQQQRGDVRRGMPPLPSPPSGQVTTVTLQSVGNGGGCVTASAAAATFLKGSMVDDATEVTVLAQPKDPTRTGERTHVEPAMSRVLEGKDREGDGSSNDAVEDGPGWEDGKRRSPICETADILTALVKQHVRTLAFCRTRKLTELTLRYGRQDLERSAPHLSSLVQGYRGGYTKSERRKIEGRLFANKLLGVTATCALELGVDIGELDVTLHLGFPGSVSSLRQQAGRAGRGGTDSLAVMVLFQDPISQFFVRNPAELLHKEPEAAVLDSNNELVLSAHLLCAAAECPLGVPKLGDVNDAALFGGEHRLQEVIDTLVDGDFPRLVEATGGLGLKANPGLDPPPCRRVGLRMIDPITFSVVNDLNGQEAYDSVEYSRAFFTLFEGAIYLHQAQQYLVTKLDLVHHVAHTRPVKVNYYTAARNNVDVNVTKRLEVSEDNHAHTGCVDVVSTVFGFVKKQMGTGITMECRECSLPPLQYATRAFWLDVGVSSKANVGAARRDFEGGIHAVGHALLAVVPLFLLCDSADVDCEHARPYHNMPQPQRILVFDKRPGGVGVSDAMFSCHRAVLCKALELVEGCPCPDGCLACIHDHGCTGYNSIIDKQAAVMILKGLIQDMMDVCDRSAADATAAASSLESAANQRQPEKSALGTVVEQGAGGFFLDHDQGKSDADERGAEDSKGEGARGAAIGLDESGGGGESGDGGALISPRKRQRLRNLRLAKGMGQAREQNISVVRQWISSVPP